MGLPRRIPIIEDDPVARKKNPDDLYMWAVGYFAERLRGGTSQTALGKAVGVSQSGYSFFEQGNSPNIRLWCRVFEHHGVDLISALSFARVLVRLIQDEQEARGRELTNEERRMLADQHFETLPFLPR